MSFVERLIPRVRTRASEAASETAFGLLDALWVAPVGVAFFDHDRRFLQVNEALARISRVPVEDHLGRTMADLLGDTPSIARLDERVGIVLTTGRPLLNDALETLGKDGSSREWLVSCYPVLNGAGTARGVCMLVTDATADRDRTAAIERARREAERSARQIALLQEITAALSAAYDVGAVAEVMVTHLCPLLGAATAAVRALEGTGLVLLARGGDAVELPPRLALDAERPETAAVRRAEAVWLEAPVTLAARFPGAEPAPGALVALPLVARSRAIGSLTLFFGGARAFDLEERAFVLALGEQCAQALDRARLYQSEREHRDAALRSTDRLVRLQSVTAALAMTRTVEDVARVAVRHAIAGIGARGAAAYVPALGASALRLVAAEGLLEHEQAALARIGTDAPLPIPEAFRGGEAIWVGSPEELLARYPAAAGLPSLPGAGAHGVAVLPLRAGGAVQGVVAMTFDESRRISAAGRELLTTVAAQCGQAMERARLYENEQVLRAEAERYAALLDAILGDAPIGVGVVDRELRFVQVNPLLAEMNGIAPEAHLGKTPSELLPGIVGVEEIERDLRRVLETGTPQLEVAVSGETAAAPGKLRHFLESWYPVRAGPEVAGIGVLVREVTAEREAEEFQRHVLGVVGHDLRSPLSAVVTATKLLLAKKDLEDREQRLLGRALAGAERMDRIIRVLLDYARVRGGQGLPLHRRPTDLGAICHAVCDELGSLHPAREVVRHDEGDGTGEWDPDRIGQVIANLLGNALDYSPAATPVEVSWRGEEASVTVEVANHGQPIPADVLSRLFEPFRRGERERPGGRDGLGLGLFIARAIVHAHGGRIECRSSEGEGTMFRVVLPRGGRRG
jgi:PAS domain S-box-containing protein